MHATFCFLIDIDPDQTDEEIAEAARDAMTSFSKRHHDENNWYWYQEEAIVLQDGRVVGLCGEDDWRGRNYLSQQIAEKPQGERWAWARLFSLQCVASDFELGGRSSFSLPIPGAEPKPDPEFWNTYETLRDPILAEMPPRLAELWAKGPLLKEGEGTDEHFMDRYHRAKWSKQFATFLDSMEYRRDQAPFTDPGSPYCYRAFNLSEDEAEGKAILFVDIHT